MTQMRLWNWQELGGDLDDRIVTLLLDCPGLHRVAVESQLGCTYGELVLALRRLKGAGRVVENEWFMLEVCSD